MARRLAAIQSVPGFVFSEQVAGTNGIGLALAERRLCHVYGAEHFAERSQTNACTAIPIRDPLNGRIDGILCFGYPRTDVDPALDIVISRAAAAIEQRLLEQSTARERSLLQAYLDSVRHAPIGQAFDNGRPIAVDDLAHSGLAGSDRVILEEKAAELISSAQRAATQVSLSGGRRATLRGRPVTSSSGVEGVVIEAVLDSEAPLDLLAVPTISIEPPARPEFESSVPKPATSTNGHVGTNGHATDGHATDGHVSDGPIGGVLLLGEPGVGQYAVAARRRLELLSEASTRIGTTLDVARTAGELAEMAVPRLADVVTIDLPDAVLRGDESSNPLAELRRTVVHGVRDDWPFYPVGSQVHLRPANPQFRCLADGQSILEPDLEAATGWRSQDPPHADDLLAHGLRSLIVVPLVARGVVLGIASFYRSRDSVPYGDDDRSLAHDLVTRAAICIDNARRYTREHAMVLALQRSLLPHGLPEQDTVEIAHRYLPAESGVGGDWFDVIPLSGARVALIVGDVVGHGLHAAVTMGQLRIAARNFAELDLAPDEVLTQLDKLVARLDREERTDELDSGDGGILGATCVYAIYDPTSRSCTLARAGHPPPALIDPDGTVTILDLPAGPPLGLGGLPFETAEVQVPEGGQLVLYTDGLIEDRRRDVDEGIDRLRQALACPGRSPEQTCDAVLAAVVPAHPVDDVALLVARTHGLDPRQIAEWDLTADPARVAEIRAAVVRQLSHWHLDEAAFVIELLLSELVTNAIRYGAEPIQARLILPGPCAGPEGAPRGTLICEVSDGSSTAPHLRRAATTDEGGRGLFLVAQLAQAWGTRYTERGKVIWAECPLEVTEEDPGMSDSILAGFSDIN
jgi:GAF domain-containing protein